VNAKSLIKVLAVVCVGSLGLATFGQTGSTAVPSSSKATPSTEAVIHYGQLPLSFEPNLGQTSSQVQWLARGPEYTLFLAGHDAVLELSTIVPGKHGSINPDELKPSVTSSAVRMNLLGAASPRQTAGEDPQTGKANYFIGSDKTKWQHDVPMYGKVRMTGVYPGIDLVYYGHRGELEYDFVVAPGADASAIQLRFDGAKATLAANGDLVLPVDGGPNVRFDKPVVYQIKDGARQPVEGSFAIADNKAGQQVSFRLGAYDHTRELVIDPTLLFLGTLGTGSQQTLAEGMTVDSLGEMILTGITNDVDFPVTSGALQTQCDTLSAGAAAAGWKRCGASSASSGFVTKISADGTSLVYSTYLHGLSGAEYGASVATDSAGDAYVLGMTSSNDFPITNDAIQTYCQPNIPEIGFNNPPVFGVETSQCDNYADGGGTEYTVNGPTLFLAKLNPTGTALLYSTFFGGSSATYPEGLALDSSNNIYFTSFVQSAFEANNAYPVNSNLQFPVTSSAYQSYGVGLQAATLTELSADGHTLMYSTLFGTESTATYFAYTIPLALAVGPNGIAYVGGQTTASAAGFPITAGVVKPSCVVSPTTPANCITYTAFLAAFDTTQSGAASLKYSTYIGGTEVAGGNYPDQQVLGLAADSENNIFVTGYTTRPDFPTTHGAYQTTCNYNNSGNSCNVAFLSKINPTGTAYIWSTMYGSNPSPFDTQGNSIAFDSYGRVYLYGIAFFDGANYVAPIEGYFQQNKTFIATFSSDGSTLEFGTPVGNTNPSVPTNDDAISNNGLFVDGSGNMYIAGYTSDSGSMVTTPGTYADAAVGGGNRTYFAKVSPVPLTAILTAPAQGTVLSTSAGFSWSPGDHATYYWLTLGTGSSGTAAKNIYSSGAVKAMSENVTGIPANGETVYVSLSSYIAGAWQTAVYTFIASGSPTPAALNTPTPSSTLTSSTVTFGWTAGFNVQHYWFNLGTAASGTNAKNLYSGASTTSTSVQVSGLPTNGETIYATLYSYIGGTWQPTVYTYAASGSPTPAALTTPSPSSTLTSSTVTFTWTAGSNVQHYWFNLGTAASGTNAKNLYSGASTTATSVQVSGLPTNGETIYATLYSYIAGTWQPIVYTYTASGSPTPAALTTPTPSTTLPNATTVTFSWSTGSNVQHYWFNLGTSASGANSKNIYSGSSTTATSVTVNNVPTNGETIYATLYSYIGGAWQPTVYTYTTF